MKTIFDSGIVKVLDDDNGGVIIETFDMNISANLDVCVKAKDTKQRTNKFAVSLRGVKGKLIIVPDHDAVIEQTLQMGPTLSLGFAISPAKPLKKNKWK